MRHDGSNVRFGIGFLVVKKGGENLGYMSKFNGKDLERAVHDDVRVQYKRWRRTNPIHHASNQAYQGKAMFCPDAIVDAIREPFVP